MASINDTIATARSEYDSFDCAQAVALIGFLGLISNFQDIIETFTANANAKRRRRRRRASTDDVVAGLSHRMHKEPWEALHPVIEMVNWARNKVPQFDDHQSRDNQLHEEMTETYSTNDFPDPEEEQTANDQSQNMSPFVNDIATLGPQLALWLVDVADGRISGAEGRAGVCQTINKLENNHGLSGSVFANLLTQTLSGALASHLPAKNLLQKAALHDTPNPCWPAPLGVQVGEDAATQIW